MFFKKQFNADAAEGAATMEAPPLVNVVAEMAKAGRVSNGDGGEIPKYTPTVSQEAETQTDSPADAATETITEEAPQEATVAETQEAETVEETQTISAPEPPQEADWRQVLKKAQPNEVLTEIGLDEKMVNFLNFWREGGDPKEYLKILTTDFEKMPAEELMKHQLRKEYPNASERQIELLFKREVIDKFQLDPERFEEEQVEEGKLLLDAYAGKFRGDFIKEQQSKLFQAPPKAEEKPNTELAEQQALVDNARQSLLNSTVYKNVLSNNSIVIGEGDEAFKFPVNPNELPDVIYDSEKFVRELFQLKESGGKPQLIPDIEKQVLTAAVAKHGMKLFVEMAKHFKAIGSKKAITPIENPSPVGQQSAAVRDAVPDTPAAMLAKYGRVV